MKTLAKENNGGGLQFEMYDDNMNIISVVTGLEFAKAGQGIEDIKTYGSEWNWNDVGGNISGYSDKDGNTDDSEYDANDMIDDSEYTKAVAEWDGKELVLHTGIMGSSAKIYFGVTESDDFFDTVECPHCGEEFERVDHGDVQCPHCNGICGS